MKKAVLIDPIEKLVKEVFLDESSPNLGAFVGYENPSGTMPLKDDSGLKHMMWTGLYHYQHNPVVLPNGFKIRTLFGEGIFFGKGILVGYEPGSGNRTSTFYDMDYVAANLTILTPEETVREYEDMIDRYSNMFEF